MRAFTRVALTFAVFSLVPALAYSQGETVTIRFRPVPDQTLRVVMSQASTMDMTIDGMPALPGGGGFAQTMDITLATKASVPESDGRFSLEATFESIKVSLTVNGKELPLPAGIDAFVGKQVIATYDADGALLDAKGDGYPEAMLTMMKKMVARFGFVEPMTVAIGDTVTRPIAADLPNLPGMGGLNLKSEAKMKLVSVTTEGDARIAHFDVTTTAEFNQDIESPASSTPLTVEMHLETSGTADIDVGRGITRRSEQSGTMNAIISGMPAELAKGAMRMKGTISNKVEARD